MEKDNEYTKILEKVKENIRRIRKERGYKSAQKFADDLGVSLKTVQGWENLDNGRWPDLSMMLKVCELTGYDLDYFTGRLEAPTHEIDFIHKKTGLSMKAVSKLIANKETVIDSPLSDIIEHKNSGQLLRTLLLASDEDEIAWLDLDNLPRGLLSSYAEKPINFSVGVGADVADYLASQELTSIVRNIREKRLDESLSGKHGGLVHSYNVYAAKKDRDRMLGELEDTCVFLTQVQHNEDDVSEEAIEALLDKATIIIAKIRNASLAEWKRGNIQKAFDDFMREVHGNNGQH